MSGIINCNPILFNGLEVIVGRLPPSRSHLAVKLNAKVPREKQKNSRQMHQYHAIYLSFNCKSQPTVICFINHETKERKKIKINNKRMRAIGSRLFRWEWEPIGFFFHCNSKKRIKKKQKKTCVMCHKRPMTMRALRGISGRFLFIKIIGR